MKENLIQNPFYVLGVTMNATDQEIQDQFHRLMLSADEPNLLIAAYAQIRNKSSRESLWWNRIDTFSLDPLRELMEKVDVTEPIDAHSLIRELAFLTSWELGDGIDE